MATQVIHALRSDNASFNARYTTVGQTPGQILQASASAAPLYSADASAIGGNMIDLDRAITLNRMMMWPGKGFSTTQPISILLRAKFSADVLMGLFEMNSGYGFGANQISLFYVAGGAWRVTQTGLNGNAGISNTSIATGQIPSLNAWHDMVWTWDGTTTASAFKFYLDGTLLGSLTSTVAWANPRDGLQTAYFGIGGVTGVLSCRMQVNEFVIWSGVITPTSVQLVSGTGSLSGASRTSFVDVVPFDATSYTDPGVAQVKLGTAYTFTGVGATGTLNSVDPGIGNVVSGVAYNINSTALTGTLVNTDPGIGNVRSGVNYTSNSVGKTGTLLSTDPGITHVASGVPYNINSVGLTGSMVNTDPGVSNVLLGTPYAINSVNKTGTLLSTDPGVANVATGVAYNINNVALTGTAVNTDPGVSNVRSGVNYTSNSVGKTGTLLSTDPGVGNVASGVAYRINNVPLTGSMVNTDPGVGNVLIGTPYAINSVNKTGTLQSTDPGIGNVRLGTAYKINNAALTGTLVIGQVSVDPGIYNVRRGTAYQINGVNLVGIYPSTPAMPAQFSSVPSLAAVASKAGQLNAGTTKPRILNAVFLDCDDT